MKSYLDIMETVQLVRRGHYLEMNDCSVLAVMFAVGCSYERAHDELRRAGRLRTRGADMDRHVWPALKRLGWGPVKERFCPLQSDGKRYTGRTIGRLLTKGVWIVETVDHVYTVINGQVMDEPRSGRVIKATRVIKW